MLTVKELLNKYRIDQLEVFELLQQQLKGYNFEHYQDDYTFDFELDQHHIGTMKYNTQTKTITLLDELEIIGE